MARPVVFGELGSPGLQRYAGYVYEEFLPALKGKKAIRVYEEMASNDPVVGAVLFASEQLIKRASWRVETDGNDNVSLDARDFVNSCLYDMSMTWSDTLSEILSMLVFGWSYHELVYKRRLGQSSDPTKNSQYNDGRIGWRRLPGRAQNTLNQWLFDDDGGIAGMEQLPPPDYKLRIIPIQKALLFRTKANKNNPEGRSMLRNAYRPWYYKKRIEEIEGIGIERDLAGLPVLTPPEGLDIWNKDDPEMVEMRKEAEKLVRNIRRDEREGVLLPNGWTLQLLSTGSRRQFDTNAIINRYDQRIAITILGDVIMLGVEKVGSFALSEVKKGLFACALEAILDSVTETFNRYAIPRLLALNGMGELKYKPRLAHGAIEAPDLKELGEFLSRFSGTPMQNVFSDPKVQAKLLEYCGLPQVPLQEGSVSAPLASNTTDVQR